jgi:hypothetical protein
VIAAEDYVEIMEIAASGPEDGNSLHDTVSLTHTCALGTLYALAGNGRKAVRHVTGGGEACRREFTRRCAKFLKWESSAGLIFCSRHRLAQNAARRFFGTRESYETCVSLVPL